MIVLVLNSGSSSVKYRLLDVDEGTVLAKGLLEKIGLPDSFFTHEAFGEIVSFPVEAENHFSALRIVTSALAHPEYGVVENLGEIDAVGHRVVHGGEKFADSALITREVMQAVEECVELAPLHNPANLMGIRACEKLMPDTPQVAVFDTAFHQTIPRHAFLYALPFEYYEKYKIRRYGFHGTSHNYVARKAAEMLGRPFEDLMLITCHLGNGASITAVKDGRSSDTSMGFTPLEGLMMGTRSGDLDPAIVLFLMEREELSIQEMNDILNKRSGCLGLSGLSNDVRDLRDAAANGHEGAKIALKVYAYRVKKLIGAYAAAMGGGDAIVFTAGIGENDPQMRADVCAGLEFLGIQIAPRKNETTAGEARDISAETAKVRVLVIPTNEELMIAGETKRVVEAARREPSPQAAG